MAWLRIDDKFDRHPKVTQLNHKERWVWISLLCYCASYNTGGYLPQNISELVPGASGRFLAKCNELELLDLTAGELRIHDWEHYAPKDPTGSERQAAWRKRHQQRDSVTEPVTADVTTHVTNESSTSRAGTRARSRPVLSLSHSKAVALDDARTHTDSTALERTQIRHTIATSLEEAS